MSKYCMIETAFDNKEELEQVIEELLNNKLVLYLNWKVVTMNI